MNLSDEVCARCGHTYGEHYYEDEEGADLVEDLFIIEGGVCEVCDCIGFEATREHRESVLGGSLFGGPDVSETGDDTPEYGPPIDWR